MNLLRRVFFVVLIFVSLVITPQNAYAWVASGTPISTSTFGTAIQNYGQIAVDNSGNVYVTDAVPTNAVSKYNSSGLLQYSIGPTNGAGVAIAPDGNVYVTNWDSSVGSAPGVYKFSSTGTPIDISSTQLGGTAYFVFSYGIAVDSNGNVYVSDIETGLGVDNVRKFNSSGALVSTIYGSGSAFSQPQAVAIDGDDNLYVLDSGNNRVQKFDSSGTWLLTITGNGGAWSYPEGFTVDTNGNIYVNDSGNNRIQIFDTNGTFLQQLIGTDFSLGSFSYLGGVAISSTGILYVGDSSRVQTATFDHNDPAVTIDSLSGDATSDTTPTLTGTATDTTTVITNVEYSIDSGTYTACIADDGTFDELSETFSCTVSPALSLGSHTIDVRATDSKGNVDTGATIANYPFTVSVATPTPSATPTPTPVPTTTTEVNTHCSALPPDSAPNIFKIARFGTEVNIYFSPLSSNVTSYQLMYGYTPQDERFSATFDATLTSGALKYTVSELTETQTYSFWMRGMNDCSPGPWSNTYTSYGLKGVSEVSPSPSPSSSGSPTTPEIALTTTANTESTQSSVQIIIVDPLGMPLSDTPITLTPSTTEIPTEIPNAPSNTDSRGVVTFVEPPGEYTITARFGNISYSQGLILSANTSSVRVVVPIPLRDSIKRQIFAPIDASYAVKAGVGFTLLDAIVGSLVGILSISGIIFSTLTRVYTASSRSLVRMPIDYLSSLTQFVSLGLSSKLSPYIPSLRNKRKSNGFVFDAYTFKPISKVYVVLFSSSGNLKTDFTDSNGRYNFEGIAPDDYQMRTEAPGYIFPSQIITTSATEEIPHVYQPGEVLPVSQDISILREVAVPMDPKRKFGVFKKLKYHSTRIIRKLTTPAYVLNIGVISAAVITNPTQFNQLIAIIYGAYLLGKISFTKHLKRMSGQLIDGSRLPIADAVIRLYKTNSSGVRGSLYTTTKTDMAGRYYIQPEIGNYILEAMTNDGKIVSQTVRIMKNVLTVDRIITIN